MPLLVRALAHQGAAHLRLCTQPRQCRPFSSGGPEQQHRANPAQSHPAAAAAARPEARCVRGRPRSRLQSCSRATAGGWASAHCGRRGRRRQPPAPEVFGAEGAALCGAGAGPRAGIAGAAAGEAGVAGQADRAAVGRGAPRAAECAPVSGAPPPVAPAGGNLVPLPRLTAQVFRMHRSFEMVLRPYKNWLLPLLGCCSPSWKDRLDRPHKLKRVFVKRRSGHTCRTGWERRWAASRRRTRRRLRRQRPRLLRSSRPFSKAAEEPPRGPPRAERPAATCRGCHLGTWPPFRCRSKVQLNQTAARVEIQRMQEFSCLLACPGVSDRL